MLGVFPATSLDLHHEVQQVVITATVVYQHDEVRPVAMRLGTATIRDLEAQVVVLHIGAHPWVLLHHATELRFPVAVADHPVQVTAIGTRLPTQRLTGGEVHVTRGADRIVRVKHGEHGALVPHLVDDTLRDATARVVGELQIHELRRIRAARADQVVVQPVPHDGLELSEQVELGRAVGVAPMVVQQSVGKVEDQA